MGHWAFLSSNSKYYSDTCKQLKVERERTFTLQLHGVYYQYHSVFFYVQRIQTNPKSLIFGRVIAANIMEIIEPWWPDLLSID